MRTLSGFTFVVKPDATPEQRALEIAERQRGRVAREQLTAAGWTPAQIRREMRRGWLHRLNSGVYVAGADLGGPLTRETEILLLLGEGACLVDISVLRALHLVPDDHREPIHVTIATGRRRNSSGAFSFHVLSDLTRADTKIFEGLPMCTVERALLDSVPRLSARQLERALDEAIHRRLTSRTKVMELLGRVSPRRGHAELLGLVDPLRRNARTESELAEAALQLIRASGLPAPVTEENLFGFRADKYWPEAGVVLEVDSHRYHGEIRQNFTRDRRRDRIFAQHGIVTVRWSEEEIEGRPTELVAHLGLTLGTRMAERSRRAA